MKIQQLRQENPRGDEDKGSGKEPADLHHHHTELLWELQGAALSQLMLILCPQSSPGPICPCAFQREAVLVEPLAADWGDCCKNDEQKGICCAMSAWRDLEGMSHMQGTAMARRACATQCWGHGEGAHLCNLPLPNSQQDQ